MDEDTTTRKPEDAGAEQEAAPTPAGDLGHRPPEDDLADAPPENTADGAIGEGKPTTEQQPA